MNRKTIIVILMTLFVGGGVLFYLAGGRKPAVLPAEKGGGEKKTVVDLQGRQTVFKTPCRSVALPKSADFYELALILGEDAPGKVAAWGPDMKNNDLDAYNKFTAAFPELLEKPVLGDISKDALNPEDVLSYRPDVILMDSYMIRRQLKSAQKLSEAGAPLVYLNNAYDMLENPQKGVAVLGRLFDKEARAAEINDFINAQIQAVASRLQNLNGPKPLVYIESGSSGAAKYGQTYGEDGVHKLHNWGAELVLAGGENVIDYKLGESVYIDPEFLFKKDPDIIIITGANWPAAADSMRLGFYAAPEDARVRLDEYAKRPGWENLKAVKNGRVYAIFSGCVGHAFNFFALQQMAKWFYPEEFADIDPEANLKEFYARFMPVEYSGVWAAQMSAR